MPTISEHDALPTGARLGEFEIQQVLGIGGFGIVYLAFDHALERQVAIKEYMPAALAHRGDMSEVVVRSAAHVDTFTLGMRSFINEARLLARFDHPSLVKVHRFWEQHGTAYMVMPYYKGRTLQDVRRDMSRPPDEAWLRRLIVPLLGALECLHRENVFHRDVAPDNILLLDDESGSARGLPVLLDLGAARRVIGGHTHNLTAIVKPSFAPIEQYAETVQLRQGPWTDMYALAAVVHFCITGRPPMPATVRAVHDDVATLTQMSASLASEFDCQFSESFMHAIDHAMAVRPQDRPESVGAWRAELDGIVARQAGVGEQAKEPKSAEWLSQTVLLRQDAGEGDHERGRGNDSEQPLNAVMPEDRFMTTIPAAGRLNAPPAWPPQTATPVANKGAPTLRAAKRHDDFAIAATVPVARPARQARADAPLPDEAALQLSVDEGPDTVVVDVTAPVEEAPPSRLEARGSTYKAAASIPGAGRGSPSWVRWAFAASALMLGTAIWWSQRLGQADGLVDQDAIQLTQSTGLSDLPPTDKGEAQAQSVAVKQAKQPVLDAARADRSEGRVRKADAGRTDAGKVPATGPLNPRRACGDKVFIWMAICMKQHCSKPQYTAHSECEKMRKLEASQRPYDYP